MSSRRSGRKAAPPRVPAIPATAGMPGWARFRRANWGIRTSWSLGSAGSWNARLRGSLYRRHLDQIGESRDDVGATNAE